MNEFDFLSDAQDFLLFLSVFLPSDNIINTFLFL